MDTLALSLGLILDPYVLGALIGDGTLSDAVLVTTTDAALVTTLCARLAPLGLDTVALEEWEDVDDPGGGELEVFEACARDIHDLITALAPALVDVANPGRE